MDFTPKNLKMVDERTLEVEWSDGKLQQIPIRKLRDNCPCATCREERAKPVDPKPAGGGFVILSEAETRPLRLEGMQPVGNYAYSISFSDGHRTGIFSFEMLRGF